MSGEMEYYPPPRKCECGEVWEPRKWMSCPKCSGKLGDKVILEKVDLGRQPQTIFKDEWVYSKPVNGSFLFETRSRIRAAWYILRGKAVAVMWY